MTNAELESLLASERITREEAERERDAADMRVKALIRCQGGGDAALVAVRDELLRATPRNPWPFIQRAIEIVDAAIRAEPRGADGGGEWFVWSFEHDAWWAADERGYARDVNLAGRYSRDRAEEIVRNANLHSRAPNEAMLPSLGLPRHRAALGAEPGDAALTQKEGQGAPAAHATGPEWECPECGCEYLGGNGFVCEGETGRCHPAAATTNHGSATEPCEEARCMSCGWGGTYPVNAPLGAPSPSNSSPIAADKGEGK